jgi:hypothetical protein
MENSNNIMSIDDDIIEQPNKIYKYVCYKCGIYQTNTKQNLMKHMTNKKEPCNKQKAIENILGDKLAKYIIKYDKFMDDINNNNLSISKKIQDWRVLYINGSRIKNILNDETKKDLYHDFLNYHSKISNFNF